MDNEGYGACRNIKIAFERDPSSVFCSYLEKDIVGISGEEMYTVRHISG